jgi:hypothetical protein
MLAEVPEMANALSGAVEGMLLSNVLINTGGIEPQITRLGQIKNQVVEEQNDVFNTPSTTAHYQQAATWIDRQTGAMSTDRTLMNGKAEQYNAWVPRANGVFTSVTRLGAMQAMLGATDNASMVAALKTGLADAQQVAQRMQGAYNVPGGHTEPLTVPAPDQSVLQNIGDVQGDSQNLNTEWFNWKSKVDLVQQAAATNAEGGADRARLDEINQTKQIIHNIGGMVDTTMAVVSGAPAAIENVAGVVRSGEAQLNAARNRSQILAGQRPTHNPTYLTTEGGQMVVRNVQTSMDRNPVTGESTASPASPGVPLPHDVATILDTISTFVYASEVRQINNNLETIKTRVAAINATQQFLDILTATNKFQNALNTYARHCNDMQNRLAARRDAYLQFGEQLDKFARANRESQQSGQAPEQGQERFAQIMTVVAQVRELMTLAHGAGGGFDNPGSFRDFANQVISHREANPPGVNYRISIPQMHVTAAEMQGLQAIYNQVAGFNGRMQTIETQFGPIEAEAAAVMASLSPGGGSGAY